MDLRKYPHDVQVCTMKFESFFYWVTEVKFQNESVSSREFSSPTFEIVVEGAESGSTSDNYPELVITLRFKRKLEFYLYQV